MSRDKQNEIQELAKQMSQAISTEIEQRYIEDEAKLRAVLIENGWRKASEVAREIFEELDKELNKARLKFRANLDAEGVDYVFVVRSIIAELKKKYTEDSK